MISGIVSRHLSTEELKERRFFKWIPFLIVELLNEINNNRVNFLREIEDWGIHV